MISGEGWGGEYQVRVGVGVSGGGCDGEYQVGLEVNIRWG